MQYTTYSYVTFRRIKFTAFVTEREFLFAVFRGIFVARQVLIV